MLHHTNVDRIWAYWETMHPEQRLFTGEYLSRSRWATPENTTITTKSPVQPFRRSESEFHTSESIQSIYDLGYSYPGLENKQGSSEEKKQEITRIINGLGPKAALSERRRPSQRPGRPQTARTRYFAHLTVELSEIMRPCSIELSMNGTYAGNFVLLAMPAAGTVHGEVALDAVYSTLRGKNSSVVLDTLESWLEVDIIKVRLLAGYSSYYSCMIKYGPTDDESQGDGSKLAVADIPSLGIQIEQVQVTAPRSDIELPAYSGSKIFGIKVGKRL